MPIGCGAQHLGTVARKRFAMWNLCAQLNQFLIRPVGRRLAVSFPNSRAEQIVRLTERKRQRERQTDRMTDRLTNCVTDSWCVGIAFVLA